MWEVFSKIGEKEREWRGRESNERVINGDPVEE